MHVTGSARKNKETREVLGAPHQLGCRIETNPTGMPFQHYSGRKQQVLVLQLREVDSVPELSHFAFLVRPAKSVNSTLADHRKPYKLKVRKGKDFAKLFTFCEFLKIG
jgi:hypothetical protein